MMNHQINFNCSVEIAVWMMKLQFKKQPILFVIQVAYVHKEILVVKWIHVKNSEVEKKMFVIVLVMEILILKTARLISVNWNVIQILLTIHNACIVAPVMRTVNFSIVWVDVLQTKLVVLVNVHVKKSATILMFIVILSVSKIVVI